MLLFFIRFSKEPEKLYELVRTDPAYQELDEDAYDVIAEYADSMEFREIKKENQEGGTVNMSSVAEGLIQLGQRQGIEQGVQALIEISMKFGSTKQETMEYIIEKMQVSRENAEKYIEKYWH